MQLRRGERIFTTRWWEQMVSWLLIWRVQINVDIYETQSAKLSINHKHRLRILRPSEIWSVSVPKANLLWNFSSIWKPPNFTILTFRQIIFIYTKMSNNAFIKGSVIQVILPCSQVSRHFTLFTMSKKKAIPLKNYLTGETVYDTLYAKATKVSQH